MIQDIHAVYHNEYKEKDPQPDDYVMFVSGRSVLMQKSEGIAYMTYAMIKDIEMTLRYLFSIEIDGVMKTFYLGDEQKLPMELAEGYAYENHNVFRTKQPKELAFAGVTACQLGNWYASMKYCSKCATLLVHDGKERMMRCPECGMMHFPKISPAVIVAVTNGDKLLLTKYADRDYKKYALIAGFTEIGETVEETVAREVMEEVGIKVKNIRYYKSQPWSFSDTILMGYFCELDGDDTICLDEEELAVAEWVPRTEIDMPFDDISLTNEMIVGYKEGKI